MTIPLELNYRNIGPSEFIEANVKDRCAHLETLSRDITYCHVVVGSPHKHQNKGSHYEVHIKLGVPGSELDASRHAGASETHEDFHVALRDAFDAVERQLIRWKEKRRLDVKAHSRPVKPEPDSEIPEA